MLFQELILFLIYIMLTIIYALLAVPIWLYIVTALMMLVFILFLFLRHNKLSAKQDEKHNQNKDYATQKEQENEFGELSKEIDMARRVQQGLLETTITPPPGLKLARKSIPAHSIGGDFYTFINKDENALIQKPKMTGVVEYVDRRQTYFGLCLGDVAGHGVSSALVMALTSGILSEITWSIQSPAEVLTKVNMALKHYLENSQVSYVTAFYCVINMDSMTLTYSKAGHPPGYIIKKNGDSEALETEGVILGMFDDEEYEEKHIPLEAGDRIILFTDGLLEAENPDKEQFGNERLKRLILEHRHGSIEKQIEAVFSTISDFSNHIPTKDDQTMVIMEIE